MNSRAGDGFELRGRANPYGVKLPDVTVFVAGEFAGRDAPVADAAFFVSAFNAQLHGPERPRRLRRTLVGRLGHDFELMNRQRLLAVARAQAVGAGVAAADDDHALAGGENFDRWIERVAEATLVLLREEFHRKVNSLQLASRNFQVARMLGAARQHDGIELATQIFDRDVLADLGIGDKLHALGGHLFEAAIDDVLLQLELGDAIAKQSADAVRFFVDRDRMASAAQLLRRSQPCRTRTDDCHFLSRCEVSRARDESSLREIRAPRYFSRSA